MDNPSGLTAYLAPFVSLHKKELIHKVLQQRTRHLTVVLENIYNPYNASAVVRSCDCFGVQDIHVIEGHNEYIINPYVVRGSAKWISLYKYAQTQHEDNAFSQLKSKGYKLIGTSPNSTCKSLNELPVDSKIALVFGSEETGLSDYAESQMDDFVHIPMVGFTESLNISVSAAICLQALTKTIRTKQINWQLSDNEMDSLTLEWYKKIIDRSDVLEREFLRKTKIDN